MTVHEVTHRSILGRTEFAGYVAQKHVERNPLIDNFLEESVAQQARRSSRELADAKNEKSFLAAVRDAIFGFHSDAIDFFREVGLIKPELKWSNSKLKDFVRDLGKEKTGYLDKLQDHIDSTKLFGEVLKDIESTSGDLDGRRKLLNGVKEDKDKGVDREFSIFELFDQASKSVSLHPDIHEALEKLKSIKSELLKDGALDNDKSSTFKKWQEAIDLLEKHKDETETALATATSSLDIAHSALKAFFEKHKDTKSFVDKEDKTELNNTLKELEGLSPVIILASHIMPEHKDFLDLSKALQKVEKHSSEGTHENQPHHPVKLKGTLADLHSDIAEAIDVEASTIKFAHEHDADGTIHLESDVHEIVAKADTKEKKEALAKVLTKHLDETTLSKFVDSEGKLKPAEQVERDTAATNSNGNGDGKGKTNWLVTGAAALGILVGVITGFLGLNKASESQKQLQQFQAGLMQQLQGFGPQIQALVQGSQADSAAAMKAIGMAIRLGLGGSPQQSAAPVKYASSKQVFNAPPQTLTDSSSVGGAPDAAPASSDMAGIPPEIVAEINKIQDPTLKAETIATVKAQLERNKQSVPVTSGTVAASNTMPGNYTPVQPGSPLAGASPNQQAPYTPAGYSNMQLPPGYMQIPPGGLSTIPTDPGAAFLAGLNAAQKVGTTQMVQSPNGTPIAWNNRNG
jgi:hypothetical protein